MKYKIARCIKCNKKLLEKEKSICSRCMKRAKERSDENDSELL